MSVRLVTIAAGSDLVAAARDLGKAGRSWFRASGNLSAVEVRRSGHEALTLDGDALLVSLEGPCEGPLVGLVSHADALGTRLVAGEVIAALTSTTTIVCVLTEEAEAPVLVPEPSLAPRVPSHHSEPALPPSSPSSAPVIAELARDVPPARGSAPSLGAAIPPRPARARLDEVDAVFPDAGDRVEHFAFGACEVVQSDGDRLHVRLGKDGRIKELALAMLKVSELPDDGAPGRRFKLERRT
ncbi:MAG: hypothetical protein U0183_27245 [Polyangiaceae bacterium]